MADERHIIMLVDDDETCLVMGREILEDRYTVYPISAGEQLFDIVRKVSPDLILLDIEMPEMDGYEVIKRLKKDKGGNTNGGDTNGGDTADIPVIFLTAHDDPENQLEGLSLGAVDYITKPFSAPILIQRIENHLLIASQKKRLERYNQRLQEMVDEQTLQIKNLQNAIISAISEVVEFRDEMSGGHIERIQAYLRLMINALRERGIYAEETAGWDVDLLISAAQMHDVGKICISEAILNKQGRLNPEEYEEIKKHPAFGLMIIDKIRRIIGEHTFLNYACVITDTHHERWDGTGYPEGLKGDEIPLAGRIMAIADAYDTLVSVRPYKKSVSPPDAAREILKNSGSAFDPALVDVFRPLAAEFAAIAERADVQI
jgi:putative two-component system response regulator